MTDLDNYTKANMDEFLASFEATYAIEFKWFLFDLLEKFKDWESSITEEEMTKLAEPYSMWNILIWNFYYDLFDGKWSVDKNEVILSMLSIDYFFNTYEYGDTVLMLYVDFFEEFYAYLSSIDFFQWNDLWLYADVENRTFTYFDRNLFYILKNDNFNETLERELVVVEYEGIDDFKDTLVNTRKECPEFIDYLLRKSLQSFNILHLSNKYDNILEDAYKVKEKSNSDMAWFDSMFWMSVKERTINASEFKNDITFKF